MMNWYWDDNDNDGDMEDFIEILCDVVNSTPAAVLIEIDGEKSYWVPRSVIQGGNTVDESAGRILEIHHWFAFKEGMV